ncbi:GntR family transcriptional regulator [Intestinibacter bartlettii]|uniref:GntR family transcriptional regulator n=1 Tax=Intestinibacter bartlettii TaxID=261299 RepID=UPI003994D484
MSIKKNNASSNIVYKGLRDDILSLKLIPGSAISETDIASKYNVSRTPVRDAFKALSNEGLLEVKPHVGTFVSLMDINQISDVLYVRKVVELSILKDLANSLTEADELRLKFNLNEQKIFLLNTAESEDSVNDFIKYDNSFHKLIFHIAGKENIWNMILGMNQHYERFRSLINLQGENNIQKLYEEHCMIFDALTKKDVEALQTIISKHIYDGFRNSSALLVKYSDYFINCQY